MISHFPIVFFLTSCVTKGAGSNLHVNASWLLNQPGSTRAVDSCSFYESPVSCFTKPLVLLSFICTYDTSSCFFSFGYKKTWWFPYSWGFSKFKIDGWFTKENPQSKMDDPRVPASRLPAARSWPSTPAAVPRSAAWCFLRGHKTWRTKVGQR